MASRLVVRLGERSYPIHFGPEAEARLIAARAEAEKAGRRFSVITDTSVQKSCDGLLRRALGGLPVLAVEPGEGAKSPAGIAKAWEFLATQRLDRGAVVVALGGGVVGDLAGFAAASYLRGVDCWQIPTTLLSMVDSSVGGKTGINLEAGKNLAGAFHQPRAVFVIPSLLRTLPQREFAAGMAEVLKYGLLGDAALFRSLLEKPLRVTDTARVAAVVRRCCAIKARVVEADEFERAPRGGRALLNLGHTFGHAIEKVAGYGTYLHGEAVAVGLAAAARLSYRLGLPKGADAVRAIEGALRAHRLPSSLREPIAVDALLAAMRQDKKVRAGRLRFVVLRRIGKADTEDSVEEALVREIWSEVGAV